MSLTYNFKNGNVVLTSGYLNSKLINLNSICLITY